MKKLKSLLKKTEEILTKKRKVNQNEGSKFSDINGKNENDYFCCPKCKERILISLDPLNYSLSYICENKHEETKIDYNFFYSNNYIYSNSSIFCQQCNKEKLNKNKFISCSKCNMKICNTCIIKHRNLNKHNNYNIIYNSIKKCSKHDNDITHFCKTCHKNLCLSCVQKIEENNDHLNHDIVKFSDLIPNENDIKDNQIKLEQKIKKNNDIIDKLKKWKEEMCSLIDEIINKLIKEKLIYQMLIKNFNNKLFDYINYKNYQMALEKIDIMNEDLQKFEKSKMFIKQTNAINDFLFGKYNNYRDNDSDIDENNINNEVKIINKKTINKYEIKKEIYFNIINNENKEENKNNKYEDIESNIIKVLKKDEAFLYNNNSIYSYSLNDKNISKLYDNLNEENEKNETNNNLYKIINALKINLIDKVGICNLLIWKIDENMEKDKIINLLRNEPIKKINKFNFIEIGPNNNFNIPKKIINHNNLKNGENKIIIESSGNILNSDENILINSDLNNKNNKDIINNEQNKEKSNILRILNGSNTNFINEESQEMIQPQEEYVYVSKTGSKYHGRPQCGRMKSSTKMTLSRAKSLGLGPCMKCY